MIKIPIANGTSIHPMIIHLKFHKDLLNSFQEKLKAMLTKEMEQILARYVFPLCLGDINLHPL